MKIEYTEKRLLKLAVTRDHKVKKGAFRLDTSGSAFISSLYLNL